jgi:hypothetical protein
MMKKCDKNLVFLYVLDKDNQYCVPTHGAYPIIIDCGFAYSKNCDGSYLWQTLHHTDSGFNSDRFDPIADPKLFLVTIADEIYGYRKTKNGKKLLKFVKDIFEPLKIDWDTGWDIPSKYSATEYVLRVIEKNNKYTNSKNKKDFHSHIFSEYEYYCFDIIQTLIILPLEQQSTDSIDISIKAFLQEFSKIEKAIGSSFYCIYILKGIVNSARQIRKDYIKTNKRDHALKFFKNAVHEYIDTVAEFCVLKDVDFEKMLCSLYCFTKCSEGMLYESMISKVNKKEVQYRKLEMSKCDELYGAIETLVPSPYKFNSDTQVMVIDCMKEKMIPLTLTNKENDHLNQYESIYWGTEMYKIYKKC